MSIISKIDQFYKLASIEPSSLLKTALATGDKAAYLVFLDALEEANPRGRKMLHNKSFKATLINLAKQFPEVLELAHHGHGVEFKVPTFCNLVAIGWRNSEIFYAYYESYFWEKFRMVFSDPVEIDGEQVKSIWNSSRGFQLHYEGNNWHANSHKAKNIFEAAEAKVRSDMKKFEELVT